MGRGEGHCAALRCAVPATFQNQISGLSLPFSPQSLTTTTPPQPARMEKNESPSPAAALTIEAAIMLRFPPFPAVPDGVELIPFHSFRPSGIRVPIDDDDDEYDGRRVSEVIERDGLGIPTIPLRVKHATDNLEKKKKRKKKGGAAGTQQVQVAPERPKTWYELWEELEDIRRNAYDASVLPASSRVPGSDRWDRNVAPIDRLSLAGEDFKSGRSWPTTTQGVQHVWDIVRHIDPMK